MQGRARAGRLLGQSCGIRSAVDVKEEEKMAHGDKLWCLLLFSVQTAPALLQDLISLYCCTSLASLLQCPAQLATKHTPNCTSLAQSFDSICPLQLPSLASLVLSPISFKCLMSPLQSQAEVNPALALPLFLPLFLFWN